MKPTLDLGELRIGEVDLLLQAMERLPADSKKSVMHSGMLKKLKTLKAQWERAEKSRKTKRQSVLEGRTIKSKAFK